MKEQSAATRPRDKLPNIEDSAVPVIKYWHQLKQKRTEVLPCGSTSPTLPSNLQPIHPACTRSRGRTLRETCECRY